MPWRRRERHADADLAGAPGDGVRHDRVDPMIDSSVAIAPSVAERLATCFRSRPIVHTLLEACHVVDGDLRIERRHLTPIAFITT